MIYVFLGQDVNVLNKKIEELILELNINNIIRYDFNDISINEILNEVNYVDLFNEKKLVFVSSFTFKKMEEKDTESLLKYIDNMNDNVIILRCIDESLDERKKITKSLRNQCKVIEVKKLDYLGIVDYITDLFKENNKKITLSQIKKIINICDNNADISINEAKKLLLYKLNEEVISDTDINNVVSKSSEREIFVFEEAILNKNVGMAMDAFHILISGDYDEIQLIEIISKQYRMLYQIKDMLNDNKDIKYISKSLAQKEYSIQKLVPFTRKYSFEEIEDLLYKVSLLDEQIKIYKYDKTSVLETFIVSL